jgi:hypothetical protein
LVLTPGAATEYDRDTDRSCWSPLSGFMQRAHTTAGSDGSSLEDLFHLVVVILIETANLLRFFRALQLSVHVAILRTVAGLDAQATTVAVCYGTGVGAIKRAARIGPMQGICRSSFEALCLRLSANNSERSVRRNICNPSNC